jgi:hypothetical protein
MLKMKCPNCDQYIVSALLAEIDTVPCEHCRQTVPVNDLLVSAQGFTIHRDDLIKRFFRYQKLLSEVTKERELMENNKDISMESRQSVDRFLATLEEMMAGARKNFRIQFSRPAPAQINFDVRDFTGWLVNLSMEGARFQTEAPDPLPKPKSLISLQFSLEGRTEVFSLSGVVAWVRPSKKVNLPARDIGVRFKNLDEPTQSDLWQFIAKGANSNLHEAG